MLDLATLKLIAEIATVTGLTGLAATGIKYLWKKFNTFRFNKGIQSRADIYEYLQELQSKTNSVRINIFRSENGGGIPRIDGEVYITLLYEVYDHTGTSMKEVIQRRPADGFHSTKILSPLASSKVEKPLFLETDKLRGQIKNIYEAEGYRYSIVHKLDSNDKRMIYIGFFFNSAREAMTHIERAHLDHGVSYLTNQFKGI